MQLVGSRIWNRVAVSNSYDDNHYTTGTFQNILELTVVYKRLIKKKMLKVGPQSSLKAKRNKDFIFLLQSYF